jgi:V/A-type H+/Na+-transporting ATPase subunit I
MVADVGYGLVLLAVLALARRRWRSAPAMRYVWPIGVLAGVSTIGFGILFGEAFGDVGHAVLGLEPIWLDRRDAVLPLLLLALAIGVAQITLGLVLGIVNASRLRHRREVIGRAALLTGLASGVVGLVALTGALPPWVGQAAVVALLAALVGMTASLGLAGPVEMMGIFGNVLSYARLMAIGLASVMLALIANRMGGLTEHLLVGVVIAAVFHVLAIVLGFFDASVQGLRLQYVEFFSKFVEPGGTRYAPFVAVVDELGRSRETVPASAPISTGGL